MLTFDVSIYLETNITMTQAYSILINHTRRLWKLNVVAQILFGLVSDHFFATFAVAMHANGLLLGQPQACDDLQSLQGKPSCRQLRISVGNSFCLAVDPGLSETALKSLTRFPYLDFLITSGGLPGTRMNITILHERTRWNSRQSMFTVYQLIRCEQI